MNNMRERDVAVDFVKFIAVFLVINSHADIMYPRMSALATGGAIGDCLFFFVSGYTLFLGGMKSFGNYYKRRICRIYPSVLTALVFTHILKKNYEIELNELWGGEFIGAIMIYYVLIYFIRKYAHNHAWMIVGIVFVLSLCVYILWFPYKYETSSKGIYGVVTLFRWIPYFAFMLIGADMGMQSQTIKGKGGSDFIKMLCCLIIFYGIQLMAKVYPEMAPFQIVTLIPLVGIVVYLYKWCKSSFFYKMYHNTTIQRVVVLISSLCLESYLIQSCLFTDMMNGIWPFNLLIITIIILVCSYIVRCAARLFVQTLKVEDYDWKEIIKL